MALFFKDEDSLKNLFREFDIELEDSFKMLGFEQKYVPLLEEWLKEKDRSLVYRGDYDSWELEPDVVNWDEMRKLAEGTDSLKSSDAEIVSK